MVRLNFSGIPVENNKSHRISRVENSTARHGKVAKVGYGGHPPPRTNFTPAVGPRDRLGWRSNPKAGSPLRCRNVSPAPVETHQSIVEMIRARRVARPDSRATAARWDASRSPMPPTKPVLSSSTQKVPEGSRITSGAYINIRFSRRKIRRGFASPERAIILRSTAGGIRPARASFSAAEVVIVQK